MEAGRLERFRSRTVSSFIILYNFQAHGLGDKLWQMYHPLAMKDTWSLLTMLLRPKSRGSVRLRSSSPYDKPVLNAGYFSHPEDIKVECD